MLHSLLQEDGNRLMAPEEQFLAFPDSRELRSKDPRPVWLVLSLVLRERGYCFHNSLGVCGQMRNMRQAVNKVSE